MVRRVQRRRRLSRSTPRSGRTTPAARAGATRSASTTRARSPTHSSGAATSSSPATPDGASSLQCWYGTCLYTSARIKTRGAVRAAVRSVRGARPDAHRQGPLACVLDAGLRHHHGQLARLRRDRHPRDHRHRRRNQPRKPARSRRQPHGNVPAARRRRRTPRPSTRSPWSGSRASVRFYVDERALRDAEPERRGRRGTWEFDTPFFLIFNVAVGGTWPGRSPIRPPTFPQTLEVDWVRVYQKNGAEP